MATYDYKCKECDLVLEVSHSMQDSPEVTCEDCTGDMVKMIPKAMNFVLKGANWSGKNVKEKSYRSDRHREMGRKMAKKYDIPQIQPNYKGEVCDSWDAAKKMAKDDGMSTHRYDKQVETLKHQEKKVLEKRDKLLKGEA